LGLSASRGVIRADNPGQFETAFHRIRAMLAHESRDQYVQVEAYIPGREFAVEGLVTRGATRILAIFDKPDPLEGPYFEETIYVTPSREPTAVQEAIRDAVHKAVRALGLYQGPFHAELRYNDTGAWILEVAARPIGGLCSKVLRFAGGTPFEELLLLHAMGQDVSGIETCDPASGVMMIPIPRAGVYEAVAGVEEAKSLPGIEDVIITAKPGQALVPLPEGASYLGFIFARGETPRRVEECIRAAHARLEFRIAALLPTFRP
jgi:biotin carboxylase